MWAPNFRDTWLNIFDDPKDVLEYKNVLVEPRSGLVVKDGEILWNLSNENIIWHKRWITSDKNWLNHLSRYKLIYDRMTDLQSYIDSCLKKDNVMNLPEGKYLHMLHPFGWYAYGHFFDTFQKISKVIATDYDKVLLSRNVQVIDFIEHMAVFGISKESIIHLDHDGLVFCPSLTYVRPVAHPTSFTVDSYEFIRNKYFDYFNGLGDSTWSKIFLTRKPGSAKRYLLNFNEIDERLRENNIKILDGTESLREIFACFSNATHVAGVHGSLFANCIFSDENCKYLEYCPKTRVDRTFHDKLKRVTDYRHVLIDCDDNYNVSLDINDLIEFYNS